MGPQHRCCGIGGIGDRLPFVSAASMGPQHRCCGIRTPITMPAGHAGRFNGAAASLLRNPAGIQPDPCGECMLQWGRSIAAAESGAAVSPPSRAGRFNGAAASLLRNHFGDDRAAGGPAASMGPQHRCCGINAHGRDADVELDASMGPQHRCCGIHAESGRGRRAGARLQWGRSIAAAESALIQVHGQPEFPPHIASTPATTPVHEIHLCLSPPSHTRLVLVVSRFHSLPLASDSRVRAITSPLADCPAVRRCLIPRADAVRPPRPEGRAPRTA